jgi:ribosomal protein L14E/L6E/L27E
MNNYVVGGFAVSTAGHDTGQLYVIFQMEHEYVYLVDGRIRTLDRPKKKKTKHINMLEQFDPTLADKVINHTIRNEEIKRALKLLQNGNSSKEVE